MEEEFQKIDEEYKRKKKEEEEIHKKYYDPSTYRKYIAPCDACSNPEGIMVIIRAKRFSKDPEFMDMGKEFCEACFERYIRNSGRYIAVSHNKTLQEREEAQKEWSAWCQAMAGSAAFDAVVHG